MFIQKKLKNSLGCLLISLEIGSKNVPDKDVCVFSVFFCVCVWGTIFSPEYRVGTKILGSTKLFLEKFGGQDIFPKFSGGGREFWGAAIFFPGNLEVTTSCCLTY